jgi:hypothetical protein
MSWTSSLLFAIQNGLYGNNQRNVYAGCDLRDLYILVVDTREVPVGTFICDMELVENQLTIGLNSSLCNRNSLMAGGVGYKYQAFPHHTL